MGTVYDEKRNTRLSTFLSHYKKDEQTRYQHFAEHMLGKVRAALRSRQIEIAYSSARAKTPESLEKKCQKQIKDSNGNPKYKYSNFSGEIMDLAGVRIVTYLRDDIPVVQDVIRELFQVEEKDSGDKLELLGTNKVGYLSVHFIVQLKADTLSADETSYRNMKCEFQVRTVLEDAWAQVFHDRAYKAELPDIVDSELLRRTNLLAGSLELLDLQINELVTRYDGLSGADRKRHLQQVLDEPVERTSLLDYLKHVLNMEPCFYCYAQVKKMMDSFTIHTIRDFDILLQRAYCKDKLRDCGRYLTADKIVYYVLMISDVKLFFESIGKNICISQESIEFLEEFISIREVCEKHGIEII